MRRMLVACVASVGLGTLLACEDLVDPITGDPVDVSYAPCVGAPDNPIWFAFQDGDGEWQRVNESASGSFDFTVRSGKAGVAIVTSNNGLFVVYATTDELKTNFPSCEGSVRTVSGDVTGYVTADNIRLQLGSSLATVFGSQAPPAAFAISTVDAMAVDLVATRYRTTSSPTVPFEEFPTAVLLRRNISGTATGIVDFADETETSIPVQRALNVTNMSLNEELRVLSFVALPTTMAKIAEYQAAPTGTSGSLAATFYGVDGSRVLSGESQRVLVSAVKDVSFTMSQGRFKSLVFTNPADQSLTLGPTLGEVSVTGGSRPTATYNVQVGYDNLFDVIFQQGSGSDFHQVEVLTTNAYAGGATSITLGVPDLSAAQGFSSTWLIVPGVESFWSFLATDADISVLNNRPVSYQGADRTAVFTP